MVPEVIRLTKAGVCGCGQVVAAGERAGSTRQPGRVVCLACVAAFSADPDEVDPAEVDPDALNADAPHGTAHADPTQGPSVAELPRELPAPVAVLIPADWAPPPPTSLPAWQQAAGITVALPPAAALTSPQVTHPVPAVAVQLALPAPGTAPVAEATTRHTPEADAPRRLRLRPPEALTPAAARPRPGAPPPRPRGGRVRGG